MGVCNSPNIFKEKISELFDGIDMVSMYVDDILVINKNNIDDHLKYLDKVPQRLTEAGINVNTGNSFFGRTETEYIGFWLINSKVRPLWSTI